MSKFEPTVAKLIDWLRWMAGESDVLFEHDGVMEHSDKELASIFADWLEHLTTGTLRGESAEAIEAERGLRARKEAYDAQNTAKYRYHNADKGKNGL